MSLLKMQWFKRSHGTHPTHLLYAQFESASIIQTLLCKVVLWCNVLILVIEILEFCLDCTYCTEF